MIRCTVAALVAAGLVSSAQAVESRSHLDELIASHAKANGIPESMVHRVVRRESRYNPRAVGRGGAMGLMQIKPGTARALGYRGTAAGLLDAETNLTYAVRYLAGAYRTAGGDPNRTVSYYARGYYYAAKRRGTVAEPVIEEEGTAPEPVMAVETPSDPITRFLARMANPQAAEPAPVQTAAAAESEPPPVEAAKNPKKTRGARVQLVSAEAALPPARPARLAPAPAAAEEPAASPAQQARKSRAERAKASAPKPEPLAPLVSAAELPPEQPTDPVTRFLARMAGTLPPEPAPVEAAALPPEPEAEATKRPKGTRVASAQRVKTEDNVESVQREASADPDTAASATVGPDAASAAPVRLKSPAKPASAKAAQSKTPESKAGAADSDEAVVASDEPLAGTGAAPTARVRLAPNPRRSGRAPSREADASGRGRATVAQAEGAGSARTASGVR